MLFDPIIPLPWIAAIALFWAIITIWHYWRSARHLAATKTLFLLMLRLFGLAIIIALLLQPYREEQIAQTQTKRQLWIAVDRSLSMNEPHQNGASRLDAVKQDLQETGLLEATADRVKFFTFSQNAQPSTAEAISTLIAKGSTSKFHSACSDIISSGSYDLSPSALILFTDGHDFELTAPGDTARRATERGIPIYAVPYGTLESARDISIKLANFHPHAFVKQRTRLEAIVRNIGYPQQMLQIKLLCDGKEVQQKEVPNGNQTWQTIGFEVTHEEPGQFEYTMQITPLNGERELTNNATSTYLNVISERLRILEIEGKPFWDSTFLRRSFARNDKFDIDSLVAFTNEKVRPIRSNPDHKSIELQVPRDVEDFKPYDLVIFGRNVEKVIGKQGIEAAEKWVRLHGGILIFSRGNAWEEKWPEFDNLTPVAWDTNTPRGIRMELTRAGSSLPPCRMIEEVLKDDQYPELTAFHHEGKLQDLSEVLSQDQAKAPIMVYRHYGNGQTLSLGVANLWRWVFHPMTEYQNNSYDRFWDQMALWLLANGGVSPQGGYSLRTDQANIPLGEEVHAVFSSHGIEPPNAPPEISVFHNDQLVTSMKMTPRNDREPPEYGMDFEPTEPGRYRLEAMSPDGKKCIAKFVANREEWETLETSMDLGYLDQLTTAAGGRVMTPDGIKELMKSLDREAEQSPPLIRKNPLWDKNLILYACTGLLALDWLLRRRWGLT